MRHAVTTVGLLVVVALTASCGSSGSNTSAISSSTGTAAVTTTPSPSSTASSPAPLPRWTAAALKPALLTLADLPAGFRVEAAPSGNGGTSSTQPGCAAMVQIMNSDHPAGTQAYGTSNFIGVRRVPVIFEELDGMPTAAAAQGYLRHVSAAARHCTSVKQQASGAGWASVRVSEVPAPRLGDRAVAVRLTISSGSLAGVQATTVGVAVGRVLIGLTVLAGTSADVDGALRLAVRKVQATFAAGSSG